MKKTKKDIEELINKIKFNHKSITHKPGYSYEQGICDTLLWLFENNTMFHVPHKEPTGWPWPKTHKQIPDGITGIRDTNSPCRNFIEGNPSINGTCKSNGHYLCNECLHKIQYKESE